ncbi:hypothetical protein I3F58_25715 [Streptomyces sp. MUM 203J]|uniref:hypothetical protein n=1 Tax=Streptomyces sp. MUM 203J TaxID=2791990 RepID=UPI001F039128|nr:hypothetical protein [Streptomyces sp. MUM 203J]MCH0542894.1 hypothetical protein [Streptomyces sp. MUM 203J]
MREHGFCHPQDVYASGHPRPGEEPIFSIRCVCSCHMRIVSPTAPPREGRRIH